MIINHSSVLCFSMKVVIYREKNTGLFASPAVKQFDRFGIHDLGSFQYPIMVKILIYIATKNLELLGY